MTKDDFDLWQVHPVTEAVFKGLAKLEERNKRKWIAMSWDGGAADQDQLVVLKACAQAARDLRELTFEELEEALNDEE